MLDRSVQIAEELHSYVQPGDTVCCLLQEYELYRCSEYALLISHSSNVQQYC
uniref:Uncharacterized protein n=1 Tax=Arundo donax TaxID=35708 RepID=A0A0A9ELL2_ARUDO